MNETLSPEDRRHVRMSLIAAVAAAFTIALGSFAWAEANPVAAERTFAISSAPASAPADTAVTPSSDAIGCGCAEGCRG